MGGCSHQVQQGWGWTGASGCRWKSLESARRAVSPLIPKPVLGTSQVSSIIKC